MTRTRKITRKGKMTRKGKRFRTYGGTTRQKKPKPRTVDQRISELVGKKIKRMSKSRVKYSAAARESQRANAPRASEAGVVRNAGALHNAVPVNIREGLPNTEEGRRRRRLRELRALAAPEPEANVRPFFMEPDPRPPLHPGP